MKEEKYWLLLAKKITGEATAEELLQLEELLNSNHEWLVNKETLQEFWNSSPANTNTAGKQKTNDAYLAHINRLKEKVADFDTTKTDTEASGQGSIINKKPLYKRLATYAVSASFLAGLMLLYWLSGTNKENLPLAAEKPSNENYGWPGVKVKDTVTGWFTGLDKFGKYTYLR